VVSGKPLSKLSCVCLSLGKLVNGKILSDQQKTLSGQRKTLFSQRKIWRDFQESVFLLFWAENTFRKL